MRRAWQGIRPRGLRLRTVLFLSVGLGATALGLVAYGTDALRNLELDSVDARFSIRGTQKPPDDLIVVQIDDVTFDELQPAPGRSRARCTPRSSTASRRTTRRRSPTTCSSPSPATSGRATTSRWRTSIAKAQREASCSPRPRSTSGAGPPSWAATTSCARSARIPATRSSRTTRAGSIRRVSYADRQAQEPSPW